MLGISVYFQDFDSKYIEEAAAIGVKYVFTSLHIPEEDYTSLPEKMPLFLDLCRQYNLIVVPDISPVTFDKLGLAINDFTKLKELGFQALRLDYGFNDYDTIKLLLQDFDIMLNASVVDEAYLQGAREANISVDKLIVTHNFYPHKLTGLSYHNFIKKNELFHRYGMRIQAFVCGDLLKRFPMYEGLPTLEKHRTMHPYVACVEMLHVCGINDVMIGDSKAKIESLSYMQSYMNDKTMVIKAHFVCGYEHFYENSYESRKDASEHVIRLTTPRIENVEVYHNTIRPRGCITMDNRLMGRYGGEVQMLKKDFEMDARVNVIGYIHPEFIDLLDYIDHSTKIKFVKM